MKPVKKTYQPAPVEYWSCGKDVKGHFHTEKKFVLRCIAKQGTPPFKDKCAANLIRNNKIIARFVEVKQAAQTARDLGLTYGVVGSVIDEAMRVCQSNPLATYSPTRRTDDGRYAQQGRAPMYTFMRILIGCLKEKSCPLAWT